MEAPVAAARSPASVFGELTVVLHGGVPWYYANQITQALGYKDCKQAIKDNVDSEDIKTREELEGSCPPGVQMKTKFINEAGVYQLVVKSKNSVAKEFQRRYRESIGSVASLHRSLCEKQQQIQERDDQLRIKEEEIARMQQEREEERSKMLQLKQLMQRKIEILEKKEYVYIATSALYMKQNYFKVGGTKCKTRISGYNTGRPDEDKYFYLLVRECTNYKVVEDLVSLFLSQHKPNDNAEMYNIHYDDLAENVNSIVDYCNSRVDHLNADRGRIYDNLVTKKQGDIEPVKMAGKDAECSDAAAECSDAAAESDSTRRTVRKNEQQNLARSPVCEEAVELFAKDVIAKVRYPEDSRIVTPHVASLRGKLDPEDGAIQSTVLFNVYKDWCHDNGYAPGSHTSFGIFLTELLGRDAKIENKKGLIWYVMPQTNNSDILP